MTTIHIPGCITQGQSIAVTTYYAIGGHAEFFAQPRSLSELRDCLSWARANEYPIAILGSGSNSLLADGSFRGIVITLSSLTNIFWETEDTLFVEAGVSNTEIAEVCLDAGRSGAAWMYRMPGQLGATVRMNARCYGGEISQIVEQVYSIDVNGRLQIHRGRDVFYGYKKTLLMDQPEVVVAARLKLPHTANRDELLSIMHTCESDRHRKHHFEHPSCGSTFKNNYQVGRPSGQVFDECGLKGARIGRSEVSQYHANFVWNLGGASARDMLTLAAHMRERALTLQQADLELEVQPIGLFDESLFAACAMDKLGPNIKDPEGRWVGLLWHPSSTEQPTAATRFPLTLMESPFHHYFRTPGQGRPQLQVKLTQLLSLTQAEQTPEQPFLRWETVRTNTDTQNSETEWQDLFPLRPDSADTFLNELWNYSVSELFIAHGNADSGEYLEFEITPDGQWIAIAFDGPRKRKAEHQKPSAHRWPQFDFSKSTSSLAVNFPYALLAPLIHQAELRIQACLSLGGEGWYLAPHWAPSGSPECWDTQHKPDVKPDFHQPQRFWRVSLR